MERASIAWRTNVVESAASLRSRRARDQGARASRRRSALTRRNVELAEQFALEAIAKDPSSAEAFAAAAWANYRFIQSNYEDTPKRRADLRSHAEKAKLLDPDSVNVELAACGLLTVNRDWDEAFRRLGRTRRTGARERHRAARGGLGRRADGA